jgi:hypothetical protein
MTLLLLLLPCRSDIAECKHTAEAAPVASSNDPGSTAWAARQLGVHYLKRYFLLIAFRWVGFWYGVLSGQGLCAFACWAGIRFLAVVCMQQHI